MRFTIPTEEICRVSFDTLSLMIAFATLMVLTDRRDRK